MVYVYLVIGLIIVVVSYGIYARKQVYKEIERLEEWKIDIMNRSVTSEIAKVKALNMTGQTEELFERWRQEWDEIVGTKLPALEDHLFDAEDYADKYRFVKARTSIADMEEALQKIEEEIRQILFEVDDLLGSEEKSKADIEDVKTLYRELRKQLLAHRHAFSTAETELEKRLNDVQQTFQKFDELTAEGNYLQARELVISSRQTGADIKEMMEAIPKVFQEIDTLIPAQIHELQDGYEEMLKDGYIIEHLNIAEDVKRLKETVKQQRVKLAQLQLQDVEQTLADVKLELDGLYDVLEAEAIAHQIVQKSVEETADKLERLSDTAQKMRRETHEVLQTYSLTHDQLEQHRDMEKRVHQLLVRFQLVYDRNEARDTAHSILREDLESIKQELALLTEEQAQFNAMLQMLRKDELMAKEKLEQLRKTLFEIERKIRRSNLPGFPDKYIARFSEATTSLKEVTARLEEQPLKMEFVLQHLEVAAEAIEHLDVISHQIVHHGHVAEKVIQYAARYRRRSTTMFEALNEAEQLFRNFEYEDAYHVVSGELERMEPGALQRLRDLVEEQMNDYRN